jgi:transposase
MNGEPIILTPRAQQRLTVLTALDRGAVSTPEAAALLGLSTRQLRRLRRAYQRHGPKALIHGNRGRRSVRRVDDATRARIAQLARTTYTGVNHQHLSELLAERDGIALSHPTIHRILREAGLQSPRRRRPPRHRRRRDRMPRVGMLVQLDGSRHDWLDGRGPRLVLHAAIDDASGEVLAATFRDVEDAHGYLLVLRAIARSKGLPVAVYSDRHGIFHRDPHRPLTLTEQLHGGPAPTHVGRALYELGIRWIAASSPQAKGRIERLFGTFQDRLRAELRLAQVGDREGANAFLQRFLPRFNARFAQAPADPASAYRPWPRALDPETVFCFTYQRRVANDNTVTLGPHRVQLLPGPGHRSYAKALVDVHERLDGTLAVFYQQQGLASQMLTPRLHGPIRARASRRVSPSAPARGPRRAVKTPLSGAARPARLSAAETPFGPATPARIRTAPARPRADHPWRQLAAEAHRRKVLREAGVTFSLK